MAKNRDIIEKGAYVHYQIGSFIEVKNFIIANKSDKKCLLLLLANNSETTVSSVKFTLTQLDALGKVISKDDFIFSDIKITPAGEYALESGIVLSEKCVDFRVKMIYALSGEYKYVFKNGQALQSYDPRGYKKKKAYAKDAGYVQVGRSRVKDGRFHGLIAFLAVAAVVVVAAYVVIGGLLV